MRIVGNLPEIILRFVGICAIIHYERMITMNFKRKIYSDLLEWKNNSKGEKALMIEGARRIGKSTIVEEYMDIRNNVHRPHSRS